MSATEGVRPERRRLLSIILSTSVGTTILAVLYPILRYMAPPRLPEAAQRSVVAAKVGELKPNSGRTFQFGNRAGLLIRTSEGEYKAFDGTCSHLDCTVQYRDDLRHVWCACHNGHYDLAGRAVSGPPPKGLEAYVVTVRGDDIIVSKG
ncbi:MAG TPA: Rieske (2Fe-2S) protein [Candidatus Kapabacteria bacterium]|nr:Rieske (2Fe-2S) protein [Candidatus Kapabacteria bacterium]